MPHYVRNGTPEDDILQDPNWTVDDSVSSLMGEGNDIYIGWGASYFVHGDIGNDRIQSGYMGGVAYGDAGNDELLLQGTNSAQTGHGGSGDDLFFSWSGGPGANSCYGNSGVDRFVDSHFAGTDLFDGGAGFDYVQHNGDTAVSISLSTGSGAGGAAGNSYVGIEGLRGGGGDDVLTGRTGINVLVGAGGADTLDGMAGHDLLIGSGFFEFFFYFTSTRDHVAANPFSYLMSGAISVSSREDDGAADRLFGGDGNDVLLGGDGADTLNGYYGVDWASYIDSTSGVTVDLQAQSGWGGSAEGDRLVGVEGLYGSGWADVLSGSIGRNWLTGNSGDDLVAGRGGKDVLQGGEGNDTLSGGYATDTLTGGAGQDDFLFDTGLGPVDVIRDFESGVDQIVLDNAIFRQLTEAASLAPSAFAEGAPTTDFQWVIHDAATGNIFYDSDGVGPRLAILFAQVQPGIVLTAADFAVI